MKVFDISWPISKATTGYKDRSIVNFNDVKNFDSDGVRETTIQISSHTGTHVDAPSHFLKDGKTIDELSIDRFVGRCKVLDMTSVTDCVTRDHLFDYDEYITQGDIILLQTTNSTMSATDKFNSHFIYLQDSGAMYLAEKKISLVGIDYLGIEHSQPGHTTHEQLMHADIIIVEGLRLGHIKAGEYLLVCLPLNVIGLEASPARAVLILE